ncbi:hypothetical protein GQR58_021961 [Nymphon striatum]|nr:hypothetical protein GQR58_021961 [Nymphon striatum]
MSVKWHHPKNQAISPIITEILAESLLEAVDELATKFGLEASGVSPSSAFRHYADKRALLTAFATNALHQLSDSIDLAKVQADKSGTDPFSAVGLAYIEFALDKPALYRAMWREETTYTNDEDYVAATKRLSNHLHGGFGETIPDDDPDTLSSQELLAWSSMHGLAHLFVDGPVDKGESKDQKLKTATAMIKTLASSFKTN